MTGFPWLPMGSPLRGGAVSGRVLDSGPAWQLCAAGTGTVLLLRPAVGPAWFGSEVTALDEAAGPLGMMDDLAYLLLPPGQRPYTVAGLALRAPPVGRAEAQAVARALSAMNGRQKLSGWSSALFLPRPGIALAMEEAPDEDRRAALVAVLSGGIRDGSLPPSRIAAANPLLDTATAAAVLDLVPAGRAARPVMSPEGFLLPGQPGLQAVLRDQVLDVLHRPGDYARLGVSQPAGVLLAGPPGCGKSFAAARLAGFLGWPLHEISVASVGSAWLHETPRLLAKAFATAAAAAPAIVLCEELDALGKARAGNSGPAVEEEVNTLLRELEVAAKRGLLVVGTTNRLEAIDPALRRKGRFDIVFTMDYPAEAGAAAVLESLLADRPHVAGLDVTGLARRLARRPPSDLAWVVNEAARLAVRGGQDAIDELMLARAAGQLSE